MLSIIKRVFKNIRSYAVREYVFIEILRVLSPVLMLTHPLFTVIFVTFLDAIDGDLASRKVLSKSEYEKIDKTMDMWWYFWVLGFSYIYLRHFFILIFLLFIYRFIGWILFTKRNKRRLLMFFPNFFENVFFLLFFATYFKLNILLSGIYLYVAIMIVLLLKLIQEYWLHVLEKSIREDVLKLSKRNWLPS